MGAQLELYLRPVPRAGLRLVRNTVLGILTAGLVEPDPLLYELIVELDGEVLGRLGDRISSEGAEAYLALMTQRAAEMTPEEFVQTYLN